MLAAVIAAVVLLREILLPFVAGMVLAYLIDPLATRLERLGMNRLIATLAIVVVLRRRPWSALIVVGDADHRRELAYFVEHFPLYVRQLQSLATDPSRPWLSKILGEGLGRGREVVRRTDHAGGGLARAFLRSAWSGGRALISVFSLRS